MAKLTIAQRAATHVTILRANSDAYHFKEIGHDTFSARQWVAWGAIQADGRRVEDEVLRLLRETPRAEVTL